MELYTMLVSILVFGDLSSAKCMAGDQQPTNKRVGAQYI